MNSSEKCIFGFICEWCSRCSFADFLLCLHAGRYDRVASTRRGMPVIAEGNTDVMSSPRTVPPVMEACISEIYFSHRGLLYVCVIVTLESVNIPAAEAPKIKDRGTMSFPFKVVMSDQDASEKRLLVKTSLFTLNLWERCPHITDPIAMPRLIMEKQNPALDGVLANNGTAMIPIPQTTPFTMLKGREMCRKESLP